MSDLVDITLLAPHRVLGSLQSEGAQCVVHLGVAEDLIGRGIAELSTYEPTKSEATEGSCGELPANS
jgi:hypothetical protein